MQDYAPNRTKVIFTKILLGLVLLSAIVALVLTGNSGMLNSAAGNAPIATIGDKSISTPEFGNLYGHALQQANLNDAMARQMGFPSMVLQREIDRQVMLQSAEKQGIRISNAYVAGQLKTQLDTIELAGTPREKLQMVLAQQKMTEKELVDLLRGDFAGNLLAGVAAPAAPLVPDTLVLAQFRAATETRIADLISVTLADLKDQMPLTDKDVQAFFDEHKDAYRLPEMRDVDVLVLPQSAFVKDSAVTDAEAQQYYDAHKDQFHSPDRVRVEQQIFDNEAAAKKLLADKPADFAAYKTGDAQKLQADWYSKSILPKEMTAVLYPAKPSGLVGPIKSPLGWHVLNVLGYDEAKPLDFTAARADIDKAVKAARLDTQMDEFTDDIDTQIAGNAALKDIADKYKQRVMSVKALQSGDAGKQLKDIPTAVQQRIIESAFSTNAGEIGPLTDTTDGDYVLVQVLKVTPSSVPDLATVKDRVTADAQEAEQAKNLTALSEKLIGAFDAKNPQKFEQLVKESGLKATTTKALTKADAEAANGKQTAELLFTLSPSNALSYTQADKSVTLVRLRQILPSTATPDEKAKAALTARLQGDLQQEMQQQLGQALQQQVNVKIDMNALQASFGPRQDTPVGE